LRPTTNLFILHAARSADERAEHVELILDRFDEVRP
jgi:hypothetical protein